MSVGLAVTVASAAAAVAFASGGHGVSAATGKRRPDLVVRNVTASPGLVQPGTEMTIKDHVANPGAGSAGKFSVEYYLTRNPPAARVTIGSRSVSSLPSHKTSGATTKLHLPLALASTSYRLTACADASGRIAESHERNNCLTAPGTIRVDGVRPTSTAEAPVVTRTTPVRVAYTANGTGSPLKRVELWVKPPGAASFAKVATDSSPAASGHAFSYVAPNDGDYAFFTRAYDRAGNVEATPSAADASTLLDAHPPTSAATAAAVTNSSSISVGYTASDTGSGLAKVELYAKQPGDTGFSLVQTDSSPAESGQSFNYTAAAGDGDYAFYTRAYDNAGNAQPAPAVADATTTLDTKPPSVSLPQPADGSTTDLLAYSGSAGTASGDAPSVTVKIYAGGSASGTPAQTLTADTTSGGWSASAAPYDPGTYTARVEQRDQAGNVGSAQSTFDVPVSFLAAGDIAPGADPDPEHGDLATAAVIEQHAGKVATLGDNAYDNGTLDQFTQWYDPSWGAFKSRTHPAPGNREYNTTGASGYFDYFDGQGTMTGPFGDRDKGYYSYDVAPWHVIVLNTNSQCTTISCSATSAQVTWLKDDLAHHSNDCTLAYFHHPLFSSSGTNSAVKPLWQALYDGGADVILSGHQHNYERFAPQTPDGVADADHGIREFVVGTGGRSHQTFPSTTTFLANSEQHSDTTFGVLDLTLSATGYSWKFLPIAGQTFTDQGSGTCHGAP